MQTWEDTMPGYAQGARPALSPADVRTESERAKIRGEKATHAFYNALIFCCIAAQFGLGYAVLFYVIAIAASVAAHRIYGHP